MYHDLGQRRMTAEYGFDLTQFDAKAADFHLLVDATHVLQVATGQPAREIAGTVEAVAAARLVGEWTHRRFDKAFGREFGAVEITACHTGAADQDLAGHALRHGLQAVIDDVEP